uniref:DUF4220 domain-containing protein n=1 Tax=Oryza rufipogon TaxID=4529 RepID=A0A0E0RJH0_ORYRU
MFHYLSADSVAILVLGHLAVREREPGHQLVSFWAPFVLVHLGGQDTITAFSRQDNELWLRHLLNLVTQVAVAGYVVAKASWPDVRLRAAMIITFVSGSIKYAERTLCLYLASPEKVSPNSLFTAANKAGQLHPSSSRRSADVTVSYILLVGAIILDATIKKLILDNLLHFGTRAEWNCSSSRGQLALRKWKAAAAGSALDKSTSSGVDFSTSVLIWHIATDMRYYTTTRDGDSSSICSDDDRVKTSRQLSSYIIYLVFNCGVMCLLASQGNNPDEKVAVVTKLLLEGGNNNDELLQRAKAALYYPVVPHAQKVAKELININDEAHRWGLIADVWVEMLYYTAPRCGAAFHYEHLSTGGEFVTHILFLIQILLPLLASLLGT